MIGEKVDALTQKLTALTTVGDSMEALLATIAAEVRALRTGDPALDAKVEALSNTIDSKVSEWTEAVVANTDAAPASGTAGTVSSEASGVSPTVPSETPAETGTVAGDSEAPGESLTFEDEPL